MNDSIQDLTIIGGGVMGLFTAYYASEFVRNITILEKVTVSSDNKKAASFSYTRSIRNDYLDPLYAQLAYEARRLWLDFQRKAESPFLIECGCLNLAKKSITPDLSATYAVQSYEVLQQLHLQAEAFNSESLRERFPQFDVDLARLDVEAGLLYVPEITRTLLTTLHDRGVRIVEHADVTRIVQRDQQLYISTNQGAFVTQKLVVTAGLGTNEVLERVDNCKVSFPLSADRPSQAKYFIPSAEKWEQFTANTLPVFAYLDVGIYGHPIYADKVPGVKIGFYNPPDVKTLNTNIRDVHSFVEECMPSLRDAKTVDVTEVDQCYYDLVADDNFILGHIPDFSSIIVGVGWRGTGYKYASWIGRTLMQLALQGSTVYNIQRFSPYRFSHAS
ncbi:MAG: N-methyl-L-tryptophan oxidase [Ktedonobacteraceae bacterium]